MSDYKPTEHDGLKKDGTPDKRVAGNQDSSSDSNSSSGNSGGSKSGEFAHGKVEYVTSKLFLVHN